MSSGVDIFRLLEKIRTSWDHIPSGAQAVTECIERLHDAEKHGYLGALYCTDYEVTGVGEFPLDMLRYAQSWPAREEDAALMAEASEYNDYSAAPVTRTIRLTKYHRDPRPVLSEDRWESKFRWRVTHVVDTRPL